MQTERGVASLDRVETVASARQLHRMLQSGRLDAIVDSPLSHRRYRMPDGSPAATRQAGDLGAEPVFLGVQARQRDLAARLRKTIESMQASGEWDLVRARAEDAYVSQPDR
jgi:ABC-type amino acid transport substrate-binding protein